MSVPGVPATAARWSYWRTNGWRNGSELWAATHLEPVWTLLRRLPGVRSATNRLVINRLVYKMDTRPNMLSTKTPYTSWESLTDRTYSARHLPPDPRLQHRLQSEASVAELFHREEPRVSAKSTLLFSHFAQWFVDGFLRTDPNDVTRNTST
jgi:prostaglandin-endoperoxide synthase 2